MVKSNLTSFPTEGQDSAATGWSTTTWQQRDFSSTSNLNTTLSAQMRSPIKNGGGTSSVWLCRFQTTRQNACRRSRQSSPTASSRCRRGRTEASSSTSWLSSTCCWLCRWSATTTSCRPWRSSASVSVALGPFAHLCRVPLDWCSRTLHSETKHQLR